MLLMATSALKAQIPCNPSFTYTVSPTGLVTFMGTTTTSATTYTWNFGNGTSGTGISTSCMYNVLGGTYLVCLYVQDASVPCSDSSCVVITIPGGAPCAASYTYSLDAPPAPANTFHFISTSTGTALTYNWNWGDGTANSTTMDPHHTFATAGPYNVCLVISSSTGCIDSSCQTVSNAAPCAGSFTSAIDNSASAPPNTYNFTNTSAGTGLSYLWYYSDGSPYDTTMNATHTFPTSGTYTVCLSIYNNSGCSDSVCQVISNPAGGGCSAYFSVIPDTSAGAAPHTYIGFNWSSGAGLTYTWVWGDGSPNGSGPYPSHVYASAGTYNICLVVFGAGCMDSFCVNQFLNKTESMVSINFQAPSGLNDVKKEQATLYPNPADDKLYIKGDRTMLYHADVYNLNGSLVLSASAKGNHSISISSLPVNLYMVKITDASGKTQFAKFVKE